MTGKPLTDTPLYNSRIINSFLLLIRHRYSYLDIPELLEHAGMKEYEVADQAHWFTQEQVDRFYDRLVQLTGNQRIAREAGRYAASPDVLGAMRQYILGLVDAASTFEIISKATANFTRSASYQSRRISSNQVELVVTPYQPGVEKPYQCENRIGFFEAIVLIFNHRITDLKYIPDLHGLPTIEHPECVFRGGECCRYLVRWEKSFFLVLKKVRNLATILLLLLNLALVLRGASHHLVIALPVTFCVYLLITLAADFSEKKALRASLTATNDSIENLLDQINLNYNNALLTNELGERLGSYRRVEEMLPDVARIMEARLQYERGLILLPDAGHARLELKASYGYSEEEKSCLSTLSWSLTETGAQDVYVNSFREQRPYLVNDLERARESLGPRFACTRATGTRAFICCPIVCEEVSLGVLAVERVGSGAPLLERDISLIMGVASIIGISIRNCQLIGDLERANEELELRVALRTADLEKSRRKLQLQHEELERTYFDLEEETAQRVSALEELRDKERMLLQQSRLAALGEMISNIAHQWRQPLNELGLIVQELPVMYDRGNFDRDYLRGIVARFMKVVSHMSKTIDDFRNFFRPEKERTHFRVREVIFNTLSLIEESFRQLKIEIAVECPEDPVIFGYPNEFSQVILNLLFNARDAFLGGGGEGPRRIAIAVSREERTRVSVADNAGGIPEEIIDRIFDPYFTTRGPEQGTGIGLYMSKIIIEKNMSGRLSVCNREGGAVFSIEV